MAYECLDKSPIVNVGQTFVTKYGNIRLIKVYDNGSGQIGVKPIGWTNEVIITTVDYRVESIGPLTVKTNFFTLARSGAHFWVCNEIEEIDPLRISAITVYEVADPDTVISDVLINGEGTGTLALAWGDQGTTTHVINGPGQYYFEKSLPVGTHNICGSIGTTQECATIIIGVEPDPEPTLLHVTSITTYGISDPKAVMADIIINGTGSDILTIEWGNSGTTTHNIEGPGQYYFEKSLPDGTYTICAKIGDMIPMCSVIVVESIPDPDPTTCPYCTTKELQNLKISEFKPDRQVPVGDQYAITVMVHDISVLYGDYVCLCLHDRDTLDLIYSSGAVKIGANEYLPFQISGQMPDKDLKLKLSVIDDNVWPSSDDCEDFRDFTITVGEYKPPLDDDDLLMYVGLAVVVAFIGVFLISRR